MSIDKGNRYKQSWIYSKHLFISGQCVLISFTGFIFGWDIGTISGFVNMPDFLRRFGQWNEINHDYELSRVRMGLVVSILNIGCAIGGLTLGKLGDMWGRKIGLIISMLVYAIGCIIQITSISSWVQIFIGRIITGLSMGTNCVLAPLYIAEISPKKIRGQLVSIFQVLCTGGMFLGYCACYATYHHYTDSKQWRIPLGLCFLWTFLAIAGLGFTPESPRYLTKMGHVDRAQQAISRAWRIPKDSPQVEEEINDILESIDRENSAGSSSWKYIFTGKPLILYRVVMGMILESLQELTGDNYLFYYGTTIFKSVGLKDSFLTSIIMGIVNFGSTFIALYAIDGFGRRKTLMIGSAGMLVCLVIYASLGTKSLYPHGYGVNPRESIGDVMVFFCCVFIFFFAITWGPSLYVIVGESYPLRIRTKAMAIATACNWLWNFLIAFFTPFITGAIHFAYGYVFFGCTVLAFLFVYTSVPETKGMQLEDVDEMYELLKPGLAFRARKDFEDGRKDH